MTILLKDFADNVQTSLGCVGGDGAQFRVSIPLEWRKSSYYRFDLFTKRTRTLSTRNVLLCLELEIEGGNWYGHKMRAERNTEMKVTGT